MKPTIPETGTVLRIEGEKAVVLLKGGTSCKGCGNAKMGLCRPAGQSMQITVLNSAGAKAGEVVSIGIGKEVQRSGYLLAYIIPLVSLLAGSMLGHIAGNYISLPFLDAVAAFVALVAGSAYALSSLKRLDQSSMLIAKQVMKEPIFDPDMKTIEEQWYDDRNAVHRF